MFRTRIALGILLGVSGLRIIHAGTLEAYLSAPGLMSTSITGAVTEDFNDPSLLTSLATTYNSPIGVYSVAPGSRLPVIDADQYGGADSSQYMYVGQRQGNDATT